MADRIVRPISKWVLSEQYSDKTSAAIDHTAIQAADREEYNNGCLCGDLQSISNLLGVSVDNTLPPA